MVLREINRSLSITRHRSHCGCLVRLKTSSTGELRVLGIIERSHRNETWNIVQAEGSNTNDFELEPDQQVLMRLITLQLAINQVATCAISDPTY